MMNGLVKVFCSLVVFLGLLGASFGRISSKCGKCDESRCPQLHYCVGEVVKDHCGCCAICSSDLYQPPGRQSHSKQKNRACGQVKCRKFKVCMENIQGLPLCTCPSSYICRSRKKREVCGNDNNTYTSRCHMRIAACNIGKRIKVKHKGACEVKKESFPNDDSRTVRWRRRKAKRRNKNKDKGKQRKKRRQRRRNKRLSRKKRRYRNGSIRFKKTFGHYKWKS